LPRVSNGKVSMQMSHSCSNGKPDFFDQIELSGSLEHDLFDILEWGKDGWFLSTLYKNPASYNEAQQHC